MKTSLFCLLLMSGSIASAATHTVTMKSISYDPKIVEINVGDEVQWTNKSYTDHSATANNGQFDTKMVSPGQSSQKVEFKTEGVFLYHCSLHGHAMTGQVVVRNPDHGR